MVAWTEVRSAYMVAKLGTVSAADALGVHRATILRLTSTRWKPSWAPKLFQRHQRGYTPTDVGRELLEVGSRADDELTQWLGRARHRQDEPAGELIITALPGFEVTLLRAMIRMQRDFPAVSCRVVTTEQLMRMEFGEAHVALRAGPRPSDPDFGVVLHHSQPQPASMRTRATPSSTVSGLRRRLRAAPLLRRGECSRTTSGHWSGSNGTCRRRIFPCAPTAC